MCTGKIRCTATHNRRYKDSVFVDFFGEDKNAKANFLALYNAPHDISLDASVELEPLRLEQVMYMAFRNDVACLVDGKIIVLVEHQSTINANMPFCVFYKGEDDYSATATLRLSDAFMTMPEKPARSQSVD